MIDFDDESNILEEQAVYCTIRNNYIYLSVSFCKSASREMAGNRYVRITYSKKNNALLLSFTSKRGDLNVFNLCDNSNVGSALTTYLINCKKLLKIVNAGLPGKFKSTKYVKNEDETIWVIHLNEKVA